MRGILGAALVVAALAASTPASAYVDYFAGSSSYYLSDDDLAGIDCYGLWHSRNEIYARNGYKFLTARARAEFGSNGWTRTPKLNSFEQYNIALVQKFEKFHGC